MTRPRVATRNRLLLRFLRERVQRVGSVFFGVFLAASTAVWLVERDVEGTHIHSFGDALWLGVVTLATVGYGDVFPVTGAGRVIFGAFILFVLVAVGFLLTAVNEAVSEVRHMEENGLIPTDMSGHTIVYGWSPVARSAVEELLAAGRQVAWLVEHPSEIALAQRLAPRERLYVSSGEFSQELLHTRLNAAAATTAVITSGDDARNIVASLNMRAAHPGARIIVAVQAEALRQTLIASGVTYVASTYELSGRLVASAAFEPEVAGFIEDVTSGVDGFDLRQYSAAVFAGRTVSELRAELITLDGPLLVGVASRDEKGYRVRPHPPGSYKLVADDQVLVLSDEAQSRRMQQRFETTQGR